MANQRSVRLCPRLAIGLALLMAGGLHGVREGSANSITHALMQGHRTDGC
jgi:hypothetical protein